jgi:hypothetical protein
MVPPPHQYLAVVEAEFHLAVMAAEEDSVVEVAGVQ